MTRARDETIVDGCVCVLGVGGIFEGDGDAGPLLT